MQGAGSLEQFGVEGLAQRHNMWSGGGRNGATLGLMGDSLSDPQPQQSAQCDKHCRYVHRIYCVWFVL